jgi:hypothetical protein
VNHTTGIATGFEPRNLHSALRLAIALATICAGMRDFITAGITFVARLSAPLLAVNR